ncbi:hypothetical protein KWH78_19840, partial [Morganella morganii]|uniref:hypothetical protein n=1 Tax=Morganella morganii TaxID=582 RepID=UPI0021CE9FC4
IQKYIITVIIHHDRGCHGAVGNRAIKEWIINNELPKDKYDRKFTPGSAGAGIVRRIIAGRSALCRGNDENKLHGII